MYHSNFHTKTIFFTISNQLKHIPSKTLVAQWVQPFNHKTKDLHLFIGIIIQLREGTTTTSSHERLRNKEGIDLVFPEYFQFSKLIPLLTDV